MNDSCGAAKRQRIRARLQATGSSPGFMTRRESRLGRRIFRLPPSPAPRPGPGRRWRGSPPSQQTRGDSTRPAATGRHSVRGVGPHPGPRLGGELTRLAKAHDFALALSPARRCAPPCRWTPGHPSSPELTLSTRGLESPTGLPLTTVGKGHALRQIPRHSRPALAGQARCLFMAASPLETVVSGYLNEVCIGTGGPCKWLRGNDKDRQHTAWAGGPDAAASAGSTRIACIGTVSRADSCVRRVEIALAYAWARAAPAPSARCSRRAGGATRAISASGGSCASAVR
jgi:hypothetical protein